WIHIVGVYDTTLGSANLKIFVNNVQGSQTGNLTETLNVPNVALRLGQPNTATPNAYYKDFRWFTNKALTQTEINKTFKNEPDAPTPDYWLKMNEGTGNPVDIITGTKSGV